MSDRHSDMLYYCNEDEDYLNSQKKKILPEFNGENSFI